MNINYNNNVLSEKERAEFRDRAEETVQIFIESIEGFHELSQDFKPSQNDAHNKISQTILDVGMFTCYTYCDCVTILKLFILSSNAYEKSLLRGKLMVLLNEGFKHLYGFNTSQHKKSYFTKLDGIIDMFPGFKSEHTSIQSDLKRMSTHSTWWQDERNIEVHIDMSKLYKIRHEEINERKVVKYSHRLLDLFMRVNKLMGSMNQAYIDYMLHHLKV